MIERKFGLREIAAVTLTFGLLIRMKTQRRNLKMVGIWT